MRYYDVFLAVSQILNTILIAFCDIFGLFHHKHLAKLTKKQTRWNRKRHKLNTQATAEEASSAPTLKTYQMRLICTQIIRTPQLYCRLPFTYDLPERLTQNRAVHMFKRKVFALSISKSIYNKFHVFLSI